MQRFYKVQPYISQAYVVNGKLAVSRKLYQNKSYNLDFSFIFRNYKLLFLLSRENHCLSNQDKGICSKGACKRIRIIFDIESISLLQDIYLIFLRDLISLSTMIWQAKDLHISLEIRYLNLNLIFHTRKSAILTIPELCFL